MLKATINHLSIKNCFCIQEVEKKYYQCHACNAQCCTPLTSNTLPVAIAASCLVINYSAENVLVMRTLIPKYEKPDSSCCCCMITSQLTSFAAGCHTNIYFWLHCLLEHVCQLLISALQSRIAFTPVVLWYQINSRIFLTMSLQQRQNMRYTYCRKLASGQSYAKLTSWSRARHKCHIIIFPTIFLLRKASVS